MLMVLFKVLNICTQHLGEISNRKTLDWKQNKYEGMSICESRLESMPGQIYNRKTSFASCLNQSWVCFEPARWEWAAELPPFLSLSVKLQIWQSNQLYANQTESRAKSIGFDMPGSVILLTLPSFRLLPTVIQQLCWMTGVTVIPTHVSDYCCSINGNIDFYQKNVWENQGTKCAGLCVLVDLVGPV